MAHRSGRTSSGHHSDAMALPRWTPTLGRTPYFRLWTSRDSSRSGPLRSQDHPSLQCSGSSNRRRGSVGHRVQEKAQGPHQSDSSRVSTPWQEAQRRGIAAASRDRTAVLARVRIETVRERCAMGSRWGCRVPLLRAPCFRRGFLCFCEVWQDPRRGAGRRPSRGGLFPAGGPCGYGHWTGCRIGFRIRLPGGEGRGHDVDHPPVAGDRVSREGAAADLACALRGGLRDH